MSRDGRRIQRVVGAVVGLSALVGLAASPGDGPPASRGHVAPERIEAGTIENVFRLSPTLYSGGEPHGEADLAALKRLGIRTILSVDGAGPDVEAARRLGLNYVHLPVGYDGIPRAQAARIISAARTLPGPVFVHCHHGKHRGPAAVALCGVANEGWTTAEAVAWLNRAGTDPDYRGLFATVAEFVPPSRAEIAEAGGPFPERAETPALVDLMVAIDRRWDLLKEVKAAGYKSPPGHPDVAPSHEARMLGEGFKELARHPEGTARGGELARGSDVAATLAAELESALRQVGEAPTPGARARSDGAFAAIGRACVTCHARHRDARPR